MSAFITIRDAIVISETCVAIVAVSPACPLAVGLSTRVGVAKAGGARRGETKLFHHLSLIARLTHKETSHFTHALAKGVSIAPKNGVVIGITRNPRSGFEMRG